MNNSRIDGQNICMFTIAWHLLSHTMCSIYIMIHSADYTILSEQSEAIASSLIHEEILDWPHRIDSIETE